MNQLEQKAKHIRELILTALAEAGSGHTGGSLDLVDIFTVLYFNYLRHDPSHPDWADRDKVVLSIGHTAPVLYATLAAAGYFPEEEMLTLRKLGSRIQGHPSYEFRLPGLETCSGSLGQGLGVALGMALAAQMDGPSTGSGTVNRVFCIMGDGEQQEGSVWESAMAAAHHKVDNLCAIIDRNRLQIDGSTEKVMTIDPLKDKWLAFGWNAIEIDGHDMAQIKMALELADQEKGRPTVIIADTIMGKGVKSIENNNQWHGKVPTKEQLPDFLKQLENS
ncbi:MAG: transketolase [Bacteroidales bacterium]|nr:transketolase [Bacteroidales bacterium]